MPWKNSRGCVVALIAAALATGCGGNEAPPAAATARPDAKRVDAATAATVAGRVSFEGTVPQNPPIKLDSDPACATQHPNGLPVETIVVNNGGVVVRTSNGTITIR